MDLNVQCSRCRAVVPVSFANQPAPAPCWNCGVPLQVEVFPALFRPIAKGREGDPVVLETEASCFYHPQKRASVPCHACGRFLCALCDCELNGEHFCPACLETGRQKGRIKNLENQRTLYDNIALGLAIYPIALIFGIYFTFITAPMALYVALRHWKAPLSIVRCSRVRYVVAIVVAIAEIAGWAAMIYFLVTASNSHG
jgi:hypothetical protein